MVIEMNRYAFDREHVKLLGRYTHADGICWCAFSGSGAEFVARGRYLRICVQSNEKYREKENRVRLAVWVDGIQVICGLLDQKNKVYTVFDTDEEQVHVVRLVKLSESAMSTLGLCFIETDGDVCPTADKRFLVEFVGDSITCGYGVEDENELHQFKTATENCTKAFAYRTAQELGVDYSLVSLSGYGVISGYTPDGIINDKEILTPYYEKVGYSYSSSGTDAHPFRVEDVPWDFGIRQPQVVFVNLGTNDASYCGADKARQEEYINRYTGLLRLIRKNNPEAYIVCGLGIMGDELYPAMCRAVKAFGAGDDRIDVFHFDAIIPETEGYAANYHPTARTHERACAALCEKLKQVFKEHYHANVGENILALTFDDGPGQTTTNQLLDVLERENVKASFFPVGENINEETSDTIRRAWALGCDIQNHSRTHTAMTQLTESEMTAELEYTNRAVESITGRAPVFFRPPYIAVNDMVLRNTSMTMIAGYGARDWEDEVDSLERAKLIMSQMRDGCIILLHDKEGNRQTVDALSDIIRLARGQGYRFVTISELFKLKGVTPKSGVVYYEAV